MTHTEDQVQEQELRQRLRAVPDPGYGDDLAARAITAARHRRSRRRGWTVVGAAAAVAGIALAVGVAVGGAGASAPLVPSGPTTTASGQTTTGPTTTGTTTPVGTATTSGTAQGLVRLITLPHEGAPGDGAELQPYTAREWEVSVCGRAVDPPAGAPVASHGIVQQGAEVQRSEGLLVFADADQAVAFVAAVRAAGEACGSGREQASVDPLAGAWGDGTVVTTWAEDDLWRSVIGVTRVGSAVAYSATGGEGGRDPQPSTAELAAVRAPLDDLAPRMCVYTVIGC